MIICTVCNGSNFSKESGLFYCTDCHTQVEGWREEDAEFGRFPNAGQLAVSYITKKGGPVDTNSHDIKDSRKRPWATWEVLNHILKLQVSQLEGLPGVTPTFRFLVLSLWTSYLHHLGFAFLSDKPLPSVDKASCKRDWAVLTCSSLHSVTRKTRKQRKLKAVLGSGGPEDEPDAEHTSNISRVRKLSRLRRELALQQYATDQSDAVSQVTHDSLEFLSQANSSSRFSSQGSSFDVSGSEASSGDEQPPVLTGVVLGREKLLALLHLGLLLSGSDAQLCDLLRWVQEGHVSCLQVLHLLPDQVEMRVEDLARFGTLPFAPSASSVRTHALQLCRQLGVQDLPAPDLGSLAQRYLRELHLPDSMAIHIKKILAKFPQKVPFLPDLQQQISNFEIQAMAHIVVLLKLLFGLNGVTELKLSQLARRRNSAVSPSTPRFFDWEEWVYFIEARNTLLCDNFLWAKKKLDPQAPYNPRHGAELTPCSEMEPAKTKAVITEFERKGLLSELHSLDPHKESPSLRVPPSLLGLREAFRAVTSHPPALGAWPPLVLQDFSSCTLDISMDSSVNSLQPSERTYPLIKNKGKEKFKIVHRHVKNCKVHSRHNFYFKDILKIKKCCSYNNYWYMPINVIKGSQADFDNIENLLPSTFLWLLRQCAAVINEKPSRLYREVCVVEERVVLTNLDDTSVLSGKI